MIFFKILQRFSNSMHGSSASNIYDSWRSTRHAEYYYDERDIYGGHKTSSTPHYPPHQQRYDPQFMMHDPPLPAHNMYPYHHHHHPAPNSQAYSNSSRRFYRDYDPNF